MKHHPDPQPPGIFYRSNPDFKKSFTHLIQEAGENTKISAKMFFMELTYATAFNSSDISNWSGLGVYYAKMLKDSGFRDLKCLHLNEKLDLNGAINFLKKKFTSTLFSKGPTPIYNIRQSLHFASEIEKRIGRSNHILSPNTVVLAHLKESIKKVLYTDSTLDNLLNFYSNYVNLSEEAVAEAQQLEQLTIDRSDLLIYSSQWAADSAINRYQADPEKVYVVPFGANLRFSPDASELKAIVSRRDIRKHIHLLFVGVDWDRKGGDQAVQVTELLNKAGFPTTLHLAGTRKKPKNLQKEFIVDHGFISKSDAKQEMKLCKLLAASDFLILPSQADCTPVVFSEANAFGLPCLASNVGGHTSVIKDGLNGRTWSREGFVDNCVNYVANLVESKNDYQELCYSSRNVYLTELNWKSSGAKISKLIQSI